MRATRFLSIVATLFVTSSFGLATAAAAAAASAATMPDIARYEGRTIAEVEVVAEGATPDTTTLAALRSLLRVQPGTEFSIVRVRESLQALHDSGRVANATVTVFETNTQSAPNAVASSSSGGGRPQPLRVRFTVRLLLRVADIVIDVKQPPGANVSIDELRQRLSLLDPGQTFTKQKLEQNADILQTFLRDRGFYNAAVETTTRPDANGLRAIVAFTVTTGEQARVAAFSVNVPSFDPAKVNRKLKLQQGEEFSQSALADDVARVRSAIIEQGYLAPSLQTPQVVVDNNRVTITLAGVVGPRVELKTEGDYEIDDDDLRKLLPLERGSGLDQSAIVEGARRLRNRVQQDGYFFADVTARCAVQQPTTTTTATLTEDNCATLNADELTGRTVQVVYDIEAGRRYKLTEVRLEGTSKLSLEDVQGDLRTSEANPLGIVPFVNIGRGTTSREALQQDRNTIRARMRDLGYRDAEVEARQGVSLEGENLIVTFNVTEGPLTRVAGVEVRGNQIYTAEQLRNEPCEVARLIGEDCTIVGGAYSRSLARTDADRIRNLYARNGYVDADVRTDIIELPRAVGSNTSSSNSNAASVANQSGANTTATSANTSTSISNNRSNDDRQVRLIYTIDEGSKVFINRILINGNQRTRTEAIRNIIDLKAGAVLRADEVAESERTLYNSGAFRQILISTEAAGENASGFRQRDVVVEVDEAEPRTLDYGFGYSTDAGPLGLFEIADNNLFGKLRQGALRLRASQRQQLLRAEYFDQRFRRYGEGDRQFAPLALSAQYQRDTRVTRFFRSTIDRGNFGIVQRLDEEGNPIDEFGRDTGAPTINRFAINLETQRNFGVKATPLGEPRQQQQQQQRPATLFLRYNFEDVRLYNTRSLLVAPILEPDRRVRLSRFGATFVRDTRRDRTNGATQVDAVSGEFLTLDYALALRALGSSFSINKLQTTYRRYFRLDFLRKGAVFASGATLGLANLFNARDRNDNNVLDPFDSDLPISERFFSGGSTTLRGFASEEAGPRRVITFRQGEVLRNRQNELFAANPFTVPVGGNAVAILNLEVRVPLAKSLQVVPFYDGGNVFRRIKDIFGRGELQPGEDPNLRARWTNTVGLGLRIRTPYGPLAIDYGFLLRPPEFVIPQIGADPAIYRLKRGQIHFRFGQAF